MTKRKKRRQWQTRESLAGLMGITPDEVEQLAADYAAGRQDEYPVERKERGIGGRTKITFRLLPPQEDRGKSGFHYLDHGETITIYHGGGYSEPVMTVWNRQWGAGRIDTIKAAALCLNALNENIGMFGVDSDGAIDPTATSVFGGDIDGDSGDKGDLA